MSNVWDIRYFILLPAMAAVFDFSHSNIFRYYIRTSLSVLLDPENMDMTVRIPLLSCIKVENWPQCNTRFVRPFVVVFKLVPPCPHNHMYADDNYTALCRSSCCWCSFRIESTKWLSIGRKGLVFVSSIAAQWCQDRYSLVWFTCQPNWTG